MRTGCKKDAFRVWRTRPHWGKVGNNKRKRGRSKGEGQRAIKSWSRAQICPNYLCFSFALLTSWMCENPENRDWGLESEQREIRWREGLLLKEGAQWSVHRCVWMCFCQVSLHCEWTGFFSVESLHAALDNFPFLSSRVSLSFSLSLSVNHALSALVA